MGNTNNIKKRCIEKALKKYARIISPEARGSYVRWYSAKMYKRYLSFYHYCKTKRHALGYE